MKSIKSLRSLVIGALLAGASTLANAYPTLQLGIVGGTYNFATETIISNGPIFSLYALLNPDSQNLVGDGYYLSMALTPQVSTTSNLGSFTFNEGTGPTTTVNATTGMTYGTPPLSTLFPDLPGHGIFPTYYLEHLFHFNPLNQSGLINTQLQPGATLPGGTGMYYQLFNINTTGLGSGYQIHFDLYNENIIRDRYKTEFAPFSHDAESGGTSVPEPGALLLLGLGLLGIGFARKNRLTK